MVNIRKIALFFILVVFCLVGWAQARTYNFILRDCAGSGLGAGSIYLSSLNRVKIEGRPIQGASLYADYIPLNGGPAVKEKLFPVSKDGRVKIKCRQLNGYKVVKNGYMLYIDFDTRHLPASDPYYFLIYLARLK